MTDRVVPPRRELLRTQCWKGKFKTNIIGRKKPRTWRKSKPILSELSLAVMSEAKIFIIECFVRFEDLSFLTNDRSVFVFFLANIVSKKFSKIFGGEFNPPTTS